MPTTVEETAPAKVNLTLHITGRRADGYHLLDSLVAFADLGERLTARIADAPALQVAGPMAAGVPEDATNLVLRAAAHVAPKRPLAFSLWKTIPSAAGIGGGSADAAAAVRAAVALTGQPLRPASGLAALGADVPVCLDPVPQRMRGVGERLAPVPSLPPCALVLVNPGVAVPTARVFAAMTRCDNPPMPDPLPRWPDLDAFAGWLATQRNDMAEAARALAPPIDAVLSALVASPGCRLARMSGSGATCFGLFGSLGAAQNAAASLGAAPEWWVAAADLDRPAGDQVTRATT